MDEQALRLWSKVDSYFAERLISTDTLLDTGACQ
jgi:hypothetical protein